MIVKKYKGFDVPDGATDYGPDNSMFHESFYKNDNGLWYSCNVNGGRWVSIGSSINRTDAIQLPQEPEAYMPEVGAECEGYFKNLTGHEDWHEVRILELKGGKYAVACQGNDFLSWCVDIRPIKTEREKVIEWINSKIHNIDYNDSVLIIKLYDLDALTIPTKN